MATARLVMDGLPSPGGFGATLYQVDPPIEGTDHLLVYHRPRMWGQPGRMSVVLATPGGVGYGGRMDTVAGTYVTDEPNHYLALQLAGGYVITDPEPELDESQIMVQQPPAPISGSYVFDPSKHTVDEVNAYLATADPSEVVRVLEAERNGKARKGILGEG